MNIYIYIHCNNLFLKNRTNTEMDSLFGSKKGKRKKKIQRKTNR